MTTLETSESHPEQSERFEANDASSLSLNANINTSSTPNASPAPQVTVEDPQVAALQAMFPDFDAIILQTVLDSVSADQDRAIDVLLGMSDPSYQSTARPDALQTDLDEEFARNLMLEEQSHQRTAWRPRHEQASLPVQTQSSTSSSTNDSVAQIQEQLGKFAESSKRTIGTLFSKVKAKIQELDNTTNEQPSIQPASRHAISSRFSPQLASQPSQSAFEPVRSTPTSDFVQVQGYEVTSNDSPRPPSAPLNPSAIGLLPKRPVTLDSSPLPSNVGVADDDELEYVTNPFEESERK